MFVEKNYVFLWLFIVNCQVYESFYYPCIYKQNLFVSPTVWDFKMTWLRLNICFCFFRYDLFLCFLCVGVPYNKRYRVVYERVALHTKKYIRQ